METFGAYDGTTLTYHVVGEGEPLICLPGGSMRASAYLGDLGGLSAHRRLVLLDLRTAGDSAAPAGPATYRCERLVADVEALREHLGLERMDLLAHSAAGNLGLLYAAAHPGRVRRLALVTPTAWAAGVPATRAAPAAFEAPVLVLAGELDGLSAPARAAETAALFPDAEFTVQPGGGHFPWLDDPGWFTRTVGAFFDPALRSVRANGIRIAYRTWGDPAAPPVVLLHGRSSNSARWTGVAEQLAATRRVYAPDLRGHGLSDWPGTYSYPLMSDDVRAFLDALGLDRTDLIGHSMGGLVAALVAQACPERIGRLVLEDPVPPFPADPPRPVPARTDEKPDFDWDVVPATDAQYNDPDPAWSEGLASLTSPALLIAGGPTSFMPQDRLARMAELIPGCRLVTVDVGHLIHQDAPEAFLAELKAAGCY